VQQQVQKVEALPISNFPPDSIIDDWTTDPSLSEREYLILAMLTLIRVDFRLMFFGIEDLGSMPEDLACLFRPSICLSLRMSVAKTGVSLTKSMGDAIMSGLSPPRELKVIESMW
jgi:hypothetical protein